MSSWNSGRVHFRERKMPLIQPIQPFQPVQQVQPVQPVQQLSTTSKTIQHPFVTPNYFSVVCAIALNEELYIDEWISYNLKLGFSHIYIYDNSENNSLKNKQSDYVTIIHFPGPTKQLEAYDSFVSSYRKNHTWAAFIDCDEFIILKKHNNINNFLNSYRDCEAIGLSWLMFGTSNHINHINEPVTKRFTMCDKELNSHYKTIAKINKIYKFFNPHRPDLFSGNIYTTQRKIITNYTIEERDNTIAYINHYYTKSEEEFRGKIERGRADINQKINIDALIDIHSKYNDVYNSDAWDFYSK